ncbi:CBS domain-containing protein [Catenuloplanes japonicus]|uniref:CBS domain-containing protein n=1 Tax=Catenuloplanes japonicus TaxID=33876 RepID=UPI0005265B1C|nr:CBS domain-containing protein [Catenuloplanes japonicus]
MTTVGALMTRAVVYLPADTTLDDAAQTMRERDIGDVVVTDGPALAGVVTDRDIVIRAVADGRDPRKVTLGQIASRDLVMIRQDASADEALGLMTEKAVRRLLVCDPDRQLVGIVSRSDLVAPPSSERRLLPQ